MLTNLELYGREDVPRIPETVANFRLALLEERLEVLLSVHFMEQDNTLINEVMKAKAFWTALRDGETI
jgi:hypothetical protein